MPEATKQIPVEKLLIQFGKSQIQLVASEEELAQARQIIEIQQKTIASLRTELATKTEELESLKAGAHGKTGGPELVPEPQEAAQG